MLQQAGASLSSFLRGGFGILLFSPVYCTRALACALSVKGAVGRGSFLRGSFLGGPDTPLSLTTTVASWTVDWLSLTPCFVDARRKERRASNSEVGRC